MRNSLSDDEDEAPLDPTLLAVQTRLRRLMMIGGLTLGLGIAAVLAAMVYRITTDDSTDTPAPVATGEPAVGSLTLVDAGLSPEARLVSTALDGDRLALSFADGGNTVIVVVDATSMRMIGRLVVRPD